MAAIAANYSLEALSEVSAIGRNDLVVKFLRCTRWLNPPSPKTMPTWDLSMGQVHGTCHKAKTIALGCTSQKQLWSQDPLLPIEFNGTNDYS